MARDMHTAQPGTAGAPVSVTGRDLEVVYRGRKVLDVPEITLAAGKTYALLGASGAGKSTLLRVLGLLERPTRGSVLHDGSVAASTTRSRREIAAVFQKPYLLRGTVADNVGYGLRLRGVRKAERAVRVAGALELVGLTGWESRSALQLSGGEAQRVALARALVLRPRLLLLDEPLSYLDPLLKRDLSREFAGILASEHITALYVTHDQEEALVVADHLGVMRDGLLVDEGDPITVLSLPSDPWVASFLGAEPPLNGTVARAGEGSIVVRTGDTEITSTSALPVGAEVILGVRPENVLLFEPGAELPKTSARNCVDVRVVSTVPEGISIRVVAETAGGVRFASLVSQLSAAEFDLSAGAPVTLLFKASAVHVARA